MKKPEIGSIPWMDLTIENAEDVKDFYSKVIGWKAEPVSMGEYNDFNMISPTDNKVKTGICHARGSNAELPPQWLIYITVEDVDKSADACVKNGGSVISGPRELGGYGRFCVIKDPAGAVCALYTPAES